MKVDDGMWDFLDSRSIFPNSLTLVCKVYSHLWSSALFSCHVGIFHSI